MILLLPDTLQTVRSNWLFGALNSNTLLCKTLPSYFLDIDNSRSHLPAASRPSCTLVLASHISIKAPFMWGLRHWIIVHRPLFILNLCLPFFCEDAPPSQLPVASPLSPWRSFFFKSSTFYLLNYRFFLNKFCAQRHSPTNLAALFHWNKSRLLHTSSLHGAYISTSPIDVN